MVSCFSPGIRLISKTPSKNDSLTPGRERSCSTTLNSLQLSSSIKIGSSSPSNFSKVVVIPSAPYSIQSYLYLRSSAFICRHLRLQSHLLSQSSLILVRYKFRNHLAAAAVAFDNHSLIFQLSRRPRPSQIKHRI